MLDYREGNLWRFIKGFLWNLRLALNSVSASGDEQGIEIGKAGELDESWFLQVSLLRGGRRRGALLVGVGARDAEEDRRRRRPAAAAVAQSASGLLLPLQPREEREKVSQVLHALRGAEAPPGQQVVFLDVDFVPDALVAVERGRGCLSAVGVVLQSETGNK